MSLTRQRSHSCPPLLISENNQKYNNYSIQFYRTIDSQIEQVHYISYTIVFVTILLCIWLICNIGLHSIQTMTPIIATLLIVAATLHYTADIALSELHHTH